MKKDDKTTRVVIQSDRVAHLTEIQIDGEPVKHADAVTFVADVKDGLTAVTVRFPAPIVSISGDAIVGSVYRATLITTLEAAPELDGLVASATTIPDALDALAAKVRAKAEGGGDA